MNSKMGTIQYGGRDEHVYLGREVVRAQAYSEETGREIDIEIKALIDNAKNRADTILTENRVKLDLLANKLLEVETLDGVEVRKLLGFEEKKVPTVITPEVKTAESNPEGIKPV
jgi:cell division protease FtsH